MTDQCDRMARPAGPPAAVPITALTTGTLAEQLDRALEAVDAREDRYARAAWPEVTLPPAPSIRLTSGMR